MHFLSGEWWEHAFSSLTQEDLFMIVCVLVFKSVFCLKGSVSLYSPFYTSFFWGTQDSVSFCSPDFPDSPVSTS